MNFVFKRNFYEEDVNSQKLFRILLETPIESINVYHEQQKIKRELNFKSMEPIYDQIYFFNYRPYDDESRNIFNHFIKKDQSVSSNLDDVSILPNIYYDFPINYDNNPGLISREDIDKYSKSLCEILKNKNYNFNSDVVMSIKDNGLSSLSAGYSDKDFSDWLKLGVNVKLSYPDKYYK